MSVADLDDYITARGGPQAFTPGASTAPAVLLLRGDLVKFEPVDWVWPQYLPAGMLTIFGGAPGTGKTTIAATLGAVLTRGAAWPCGSPGQGAGDVIVWSGEDAPAVLAARFAAAGADMKRVHFVENIADGEPFDPGRDMPLLEATVADLAAPRLLILDPIVSAVTGDSHKGAEVRRSLQPVVHLAQHLGCAVLGITHFSKGTGGRDPVERVTGSIAFAALARMVLVAAKVKSEGGDDEEPRRVLLRAKSNVGPDDGGFAYALERVEVAPEVEGQRARWLEPLHGTARELLGEAEADAAAAGDADDVAGFLRSLLAAGPVSAKGIKADADGAGYSWDQVKRASLRIGVDKKKDGLKGGWIWTLLPEGSAKGAKGAGTNSALSSHSSALPSGRMPTADDDAEVL